MYKLIFKDIKLLINQFVISIPIGIIMVILFTPRYPSFGYAMGAFAIAWMSTLIASSFEAKNHSEIIINSLPVLRSEIILAKYISAYVYAIFGLLLVAFAGLLINISPLPYHLPCLNWQNIAIALISISVLVSIYYPFFYRFYNQIVIILVNVVLFQVLFFMPSYISDYMQGHMSEAWVQQLLQINMHTPWILPLIGITLASLPVVFSYWLTTRVYTARDF